MWTSIQHMQAHLEHGTQVGKRARRQVLLHVQVPQHILSSVELVLLYDFCELADGDGGGSSAGGGSRLRHCIRLRADGCCQAREPVAGAHEDD